VADLAMRKCRTGRWAMARGDGGSFSTPGVKDDAIEEAEDDESDDDEDTREQQQRRRDPNREAANYRRRLRATEQELAKYKPDPGLENAFLKLAHKRGFHDLDAAWSLAGSFLSDTNDPEDLVERVADSYPWALRDSSTNETDEGKKLPAGRTAPSFNNNKNRSRETREQAMKRLAPKYPSLGGRM
jgi:hypothetical protein